jgi:hypothetical protein
MRSAQPVEPAEVMEALTELAESIGFAVAVHSGPRGSTGDIVWEIRTVTINGDLDAEQQATELVNIVQFGRCQQTPTFLLARMISLTTLTARRPRYSSITWT